MTDTLPPDDIISEDFWRKMKARMLTSHYKYFPKYGPLRDSYPGKIDSLATANERIRLYEKTGNTEWLIDAANQLMIEFMLPGHSEAHFRATDSDESPGLVHRAEYTEVDPTTLAMRKRYS